DAADIGRAELHLLGLECERRNHPELRWVAYRLSSDADKSWRLDRRDGVFRRDMELSVELYDSARSSCAVGDGSRRPDGCVCKCIGGGNIRNRMHRVEPGGLPCELELRS